MMLQEAQVWNMGGTYRIDEATRVGIVHASLPDPDSRNQDLAQRLVTRRKSSPCCGNCAAGSCLVG